MEEFTRDTYGVERTQYIEWDLDDYSIFQFREILPGPHNPIWKTLSVLSLSPHPEAETNWCPGFWEMV